MAAIWNAGLIFTSLFMSASIPYDGNPVGLCDSHKHVILPAKYSLIDYVGHGLFMAWSLNRDDKFEYGKERFLFDQKGIRLNTKLLEDTRLIQVFWLGKKADENSELTFTALPDETLLLLLRNGKFGLCNSKGKIVLPLNYQFIGKACEGKAFLADTISNTPASRLYIFDCAHQTLTEIPHRTINDLNSVYFSDGLAAISNATELSDRNSRKGYIDETGAFVVEPRFSDAGPFRNGVAAVTLPNQPPDQPSKVIIDKTGKVVSPPNMEVENFYGDYAVARKMDTEPPKYGIVDRDFSFVVEPKYKKLSPNWKTDVSLLGSPAFRFAQTPSLYTAIENTGQPQKLITATGELLVTLPARHFFNYLEDDGSIRCWVAPPDVGSSGHTVYLNMHGEQVSRPPETSRLHHIWYQQIAPERQLETVNADDGKFDPAYWKNGHDYAISRQAMFGRFLSEYDLIGLSRKQVRRYLGSSNWCMARNSATYSYALGTGCMFANGPAVIVRMKNDKVESWCFFHDGKMGPSITSNVILDSPKENVIFTDSLLTKTKPK
jgi:hypothetical protein